jgi:hypothetical protein
MATRTAGFGLVIDLPIDIFKDGLRGGVRAVLGKFG